MSGIKKFRKGIIAFILIALLVVLSSGKSYSLTGCTNCREADSLALVALYNATDGAHWTNNTNWLVPGQPIDTWYGVTKIMLKRVKKLELANNGLRGYIHDSLGYLNKLTVLDLQENQLEGSLPSSFSNLTGITNIYLNNNELYGNIPDAFNNLLYLDIFHIYNNKFKIADIANSKISPAKTNFLYAPQAEIPAPDVVVNGNIFTLTINEINPGNHFAWYINDIKVEGVDTYTYSFVPIEISNVYVEVSNETYSIQGDYYKNLILKSNSVNIIPVIEEDTARPVAIAKNVTAFLDERGFVSITSAMIDNGSWDDSGIISMTVAPSDFNCSNVGDNTVILTVTDNNGNSSTAEAIVKIEDKIAPAVNVGNITLQLDALGSASLTAEEVENSSSDNCGIASKVLSQSSFSCDNIGENIDTLIVIDINGNVSKAVFTVIVEDKTAPEVITQNVTLELDQSGNAVLTTAQVNKGSNDACGIESIQLSKSEFSCENLGDNTVTLTITDAAGNTSTGDAVVKVLDLIAPEITAPASVSITIKQGEVPVIELGSPVTNDNCGVKEVTNDSPQTFEEGITNVTWTVTDESGNTSTAIQVVEIIVDHNKLPVIISMTSNSPVELGGASEVEAEFSDDNLKSATFDWGDGATSNGNIVGQKIFGTHIYAEKGNYTVILSIYDEAGESATMEYVNSVVDNNTSS